MIVFGDRFMYTEVLDILPKMSPTRQVIPDGIGLSRQVLKQIIDFLCTVQFGFVIALQWYDCLYVFILFSPLYMDVPFAASMNELIYKYLQRQHYNIASYSKSCDTC